MATTKATLLGHRSATSFADLTLSGDLTVNGTTTTLDTAVQNVDKLEIGASSTDYGAKINQTSTGNILQLQDGGTDVMVVKDGGNVGIGTSSPSCALHVHTDNSDSTNYLAQRWGNSTTTHGYVDFQLVNPGSTSSGFPRLDLEIGNSPIMSFVRGGNVGIGTTSPTSSTGNTLEIYDANTPTFKLNDGGQYQAYLKLGGNDLEIRGSSGAMEFYTGSADGESSTHQMTIDSIGRIYFKAYASLSTNYSTGESANAFIGTGSYGGVIYRATSSRRFKTNIVDTAKGLNELLTLRPVDFTSLCEADDKDRLKTGFIGEEVDDAGFDEYIQRGSNGEVDGLNYSHMVALCVKSIQELSAKVTALENA